jgi:ProP effector
MRKQELHPRTAIINKKQKNESKNARLNALRWLAKKFPSAFDNSLQIRPLKLGIMDDVLTHADDAEKEGISKSKLREAVVVFTRRIDYLTSLKAQEIRIDLDGNPTAAVTEDEAEKAASKIKRRVENSAKNARKTSTTPTPTPSINRPVYPSNYKSAEHAPTYYSERSSDSDISGGSYNKPVNSPKSPAVIVKTKSSKQLDPQAVARLKEKLGLSRKKEAAE